MNGAHEYAGLFKSAQYGNLYLLSPHHARGQTFQIFVVPEGFQIKLGGINAPHGCIEVYGILGGHPGWTEFYGWIHKGPWQQDFYKLVAERRAEIEKLEQEKAEALAKWEKGKSCNAIGNLWRPIMNAQTKPELFAPCFPLLNIDLVKIEPARLDVLVDQVAADLVGLSNADTTSTVNTHWITFMKMPDIESCIEVNQ
ncbi:hypothetical protein [Acinetobacter sp. NS-4]|uniref:hypothetical protein n=1 Tax=Acinetobacter sp. NS-4 TaxID=3127956 RepID=UPI00307F7DF2